jgi:uncharacterized protein with HEPN domain
MALHSVKPRLDDILENIRGVADLVANADFEAYKRNFGMRRAVERCVEIISEASRHIPADMKALHPEAYWVEIRAVGNLLRHEYQRVDDLIMWRIATRYLPALEVVVLDLSRRIGEP